MTPALLYTFPVLPADFVIIGVILLILIVVLIAGSAIIVGVPYVPTSTLMANAMIDFAGLRGSETVWDVGAGSGTILIATKERFPSVTAIGVEYSPVAWLLGIVKILLSRKRITFLRRNAHNVDLSSADVVFLYLFPGAMGRFEEKFDRELKPGTIVISHAFPFPRRQPSEVRHIPEKGKTKTLLRYDWR